MVAGSGLEWDGCEIDLRGKSERLEYGVVRERVASKVMGVSWWSFEGLGMDEMC